MKKTPIIINGAQGKMGCLACEAIRQHPHFELAACLGRHDNLKQTIIDTGAPIVLDLTSAEVVYANTLTIIEAGAHPVIGTSGLLSKEITHLQGMCAEKKWGALIIPNFSISAVLMMQFAAMASKFFPAVEIIEAHHQQKVDAPSGTAIKTASMIAAARTETTPVLPRTTGLPGARGAHYEQVPIHSIRLPGILARQQVIFGNEGETLSITHDTIDRHSFMPGVILACQRVMELDGLLYGLEQLL